ncbi:hypothetical protein SAMN05446037_103912 [Anaerovirgula multivorans]|uniref:Heat induced stress protein YflT n=1 Tax=Anaerovirgula multivorans TaxID=312168 RepID=A0A239JTN9_9FIRM|nr:hypothetical protein [Anaerovirgula multivorans]SNT09286.1 hypothetical protein SAMN05446037_103912 [Anaerovirgula multivorans]
MKTEGYFDSLKEANEAITALKNAGFKNTSLDLMDETIKEKNVITNLPGTEMNTSLSDLVLESGNRGIDIGKAPLSAADPMVSGMAGFEEIADLSHKIVVEADSKDIKEAKSIISKMGGSSDNLKHYQ